MHCVHMCINKNTMHSSMDNETDTCGYTHNILFNITIVIHTFTHTIYINIYCIQNYYFIHRSKIINVFKFIF